MPTSETGKADVQPGGGGDAGSPQVIFTTTNTTPNSTTQGTIQVASVLTNNSLVQSGSKVTVEPANLDSANLTGDFAALGQTAAQLSEFEDLETIQAELDQLDEPGDGLGVSSVSAVTQAPIRQLSGNLTQTTGVSLLNTSASLAAAQVASAVETLNSQNVVLHSAVSSSQPQSLIKRSIASASGHSGQVFTKVIITKNPSTSQPHAIPASGSLTQPMQYVLTSPASIADTGSQLSQGIPTTPTKTITITQGSLLSPTKLVSALPATPTKLLSGQRFAISPIKSPGKITMIPVSGKSPQRIAPAPGQQFITMVAKTNINTTSMATTTMSTASTTKPATITMSPSKVVFRHQVPGTGAAVGKPLIAQQLNMGPKVSSVMNMGNVQPLSVSGSKFQYVRLVAAPPGQNNTGMKTSLATTPLQAKPLIPVSQAQQMKITLPTQQMQQMIARPSNQGQAQRIILPATSQMSIRPQIRPNTATSLAGLPPGTTIISSNQNMPGVQQFALVPAQYVQQQQQQQQQQQPVVNQTSQLRQDGYVPIASNSMGQAPAAATTGRNNLNGRTMSEPSGQRPRKPCNCTKSQCLKLYCDCFANGEFCHNCNCSNCANNLEHEEERSRAIKSCLDRNPLAFHPKIGKGKGRGIDGNRRHNKGCNCKRSGCLKNYCECYEAKIPCSNLCKCVGCKNYEESPDRKTLMHLADAAEVRVQQQTAAKTKLSSQIQDLPARPPPPVTGERLPYTFVTREVAGATCSCLMAQAEESERTRQIEIIQERMVLEEFGRCLMQVIDSANKTRAPSPGP